RDLVQGAEKTAERQLRAYVGPEGGSVVLTWSGPGGVTPNLHVSLVIKNSGLTPGSAFISRVEVKIDAMAARPFHPPIGDPGTRPNEARTIVAPGTKREVALDHPSTVADITAVRARTRAIFVWGRLDYV